MGLTDLFGVGDALRTISQDGFYYVTADRMPRRTMPPITVVLATDGDLRFLQTTWPLDHAILADVVDEISAHEPAALFMDTLFLDVRDPASTAALENAVARTAGRAPLVMASPDLPTSGWRAPESRDLYRRLTASGVVVANANFSEQQGETLVMQQSRRQPSVAAVLRDLYCAKGADCARFESRRDAALELAWRGRPVTCDGSDDCRAIPSGEPWRFASMATGAVFPSLKSQPLSAQGLLPYQTITLETLLTDPEAGAALKGRTVLFGFSFRGITDAAASPTFGTVPGVYAHAALFDGLVVWGDRNFVSAFPFDLPKPAYELLMIAALTIVMFAVRLGLLARSGPAMDPGWLEWFSSLAVFLAGLVVALIEATVSRTTPEHWLIAPTIVSASGFIWLQGAKLYVDTRLFGRRGGNDGGGA
nr:CHASE2 domain-containing protein [Caulobacter sp. SLTY]